MEFDKNAVMNIISFLCGNDITPLPFSNDTVQK